MIIKDSKGYWVSMRRNPEPIHFWSTKKADAAQFHFYEAAERILKMLPQKAHIQ